MQGTAALRSVARTSLELVRRAAEAGAYPETLPAAAETPGPYRNCRLRLERLDNGGAVLSLPGADGLRRKYGGWKGRHEPPRLRWELPAPARLR